jgi:hypothetical protein
MVADYFINSVNTYTIVNEKCFIKRLFPIDKIYCSHNNTKVRIFSTFYPPNLTKNQNFRVYSQFFYQIFFILLIYNVLKFCNFRFFLKKNLIFA